MKNYWAEAQQGATTPKEKIAALIAAAERIVIGAGAGLSTAAGFTYSGERFQRYFTDFARRFGIRDMYSGGFYPYPDHETYWGWWCRHIWVNRYIPLPSDLYARLLCAVEGRDFFVLTTNVDHAFQRAGFPKKHLFYTQGDYGLFLDERAAADVLCQRQPRRAARSARHRGSRLCVRLRYRRCFLIYSDS
ncbi:MAG: hypothetical protein SPL39_03580 [Selenomonadaceae bacterium]|nr:hypothetical protein [Selenomonadaceae bacterium]